MPRRLASWVLDYAKSVDSMSEAPQAFNVWCAIGVIGAVLKKQVWVHRGLYKIYPNQYIVLVSPPGIGKGSSIHPAFDFPRNSTPQLANFMSDRITAPKIIERLAAGYPTTTIKNGNIITGKDSSCVLMATELSSFLSSSDWMTTFLCDAWDRNEYEYDTKNKGTHTVKDMCVSLMGACVPEFIRSINRENATAINGGFTARTVFVFANEKSKSIPWPSNFMDSPTGRKLHSDLTHDLNEISKLSGEFTWTPKARYHFEKFYKSCIAADEDTEVVRHFKSRQNVHVCKVAMCLSAAMNDTLVIDELHVTGAISLTNQVRDTLDITFRGVGESPLAEATARIQTYIERKGYVSRRELLRDNYRHITNDDLDRVIYLLENIGLIKGTHSGGNQFYKHIGKNNAVQKGNTNIP